MSELFASCTPGLEAALAGELRELGLANVLQVPGGVEATGSIEQVNLRSRVASRVLLRVGAVSEPDALKKVSLPNRLPVLHIEGADRAWQAAAISAWGESNDGLPVFLRLHRGECIVSVDTSGELLHMRGYRQEVGRAPMRETLAAGMLRIAKYDPTAPLWDVMCGSGTLIIEAAEYAAGLPAGRQRAFAFERWAPRPVIETHARSHAAIIGTDLNAGALGTARRNAKRAQVFERLTLERLDATALAAKPGPPGLIVANLPYGKRAGEKSELGSLYRALGSSLKRACRGWRFAFLLEDGAESLGLELTHRHRVSNGGLGCEIVQGQL